MEQTRQQLKRKEREEEEEHEFLEKAMADIPYVEKKKPKVTKEKNIDVVRVKLWK